MIISTNTTSHSSHGYEKDKRRNLNQDELDFFRSLSVDATLPSYPITTTSLSSPESEYAQPAFPMSLQQGDDYALTRSQDKISLPEILLVRTCTGPLAGLMIQVSWLGPQLTIKLSTSEKNLAERLAKQGKKLSEALSGALGISVSVGVGHVL